MSNVPQIAYPVTVPAGTLRLHFTDLTTKDLSITGGVSRYNARSTDEAVDALAYLAAQAEAADAPTGGTWDAGEANGYYKGLPTLTNATRTDGKTLGSIEFRDGLSGALFGFDLDTIVVSGGVAVGLWQRRGLWLPSPVIDGGPYAALIEPTTSDAVMLTESPDGSVTRDAGGRLTRWTIELEDLPPASVLPHYSEQLVWANEVYGVAGDPNMALESWRRNFLDDDADSFRLWPDHEDLSTFYDLRPGQGDDWIAGLGDFLVEISRQPYLLGIVLTALEV